MAVKPSPDPGNAKPFDTFPEPISAPESMRKLQPVDDWIPRYSDLVALRAAAARLSATIEWEPLLNGILEAVIDLARAESGAVMLLDEGTGDLRVAAERNLPDTVRIDPHVLIGDGAIGWVAKELKPLLLVGRDQLMRYPEPFSRDRTASSVCAPLYHPSACGKPALLGVLIVNRTAGALALTQDDVRLISAFADQASASLQNARCYHRLQRRAIHLENLIDISRSLIATLQVDAVLRSIVDRAVELLGCQAGSLLLVDSETQELVFKVAVGPVGKQLVGMRLPPGAGIAGTVAKEGVPLIVNDAKADPRHYGKVDASTALKTKSLLCVPLVNKECILGVVEVMNKLDGTLFDDDDRDLLAAFAVQGAIALENARLYSDLRSAFADTVQIIANALDARDKYTAGHTGRVTELALAIAREMSWSREQLDILQIGALLHDIGKIGISDMILYKPTELTRVEYVEMMRHPIVGAKMLEGVAALRPMLPYILYHQERYDGLGYPFGLKGAEIPLEGRILAAADTFDAMTSDRPYRRGLSEEQALAEILGNRGTQFDPDVVDALVRALQKKKTQTGRSG